MTLYDHDNNKSDQDLKKKISIHIVWHDDGPPLVIWTSVRLEGYLVSGRISKIDGDSLLLPARR